MKNEKVYRLDFLAHGIGDLIVCSSLPENFYKLTGNKVLVDDYRAKWVFRYNPYVMFDCKSHDIQNIPMMIEARYPDIVQKYIKDKNTFTISSLAEWIMYCVGLDTDKAILRHPRLYIHEDLPQQSKKLTVHTTGSNRALVGEVQVRHNLGEDAERIMSDDVMKAIHENYEGWEIVQIGGEDDKPLGGNSIDLRGKLDMFDVAKEIATSQRFIGVVSGLMHMANAYPKVEKRIILMEFPDTTLKEGFQSVPLRPGEVRNRMFAWLDPNNTFYNKYKEDAGITYSYLKL